MKSGAAKVAIQPAPTSEFFQMDTDFYPLYVAAADGTPLVEKGKATFADATGDRVANLWSHALQGEAREPGAVPG